jgi:TonB family protein
LIHFDFDGRREDELVVGNAMSPREGVLLSVVVHAAALILALLLPALGLFELSPEDRQAELVEVRQQEEEPVRFVFVQPLVDVPAPEPPPTNDLSDLDRQAQAPRRALEPENPLPFALGNSVERAEAPPVPESSVEERRQGPETEIEPNLEPPGPEPAEELARLLPPADTGLRRAPETSRPAPGLLGDALRDLERYVDTVTFHNDRGGTGEPGASIQFDSRGVDFGSWLRRFVAQVRRNWFLPQAAMNFSGHVVLQFYIHKDGRITDLQVVGASGIDAFNRAAHNAIRGSNPTAPLPPEYPEPQAFFTVTFYYNENPPLR